MLRTFSAPAGSPRMIIPMAAIAAVPTPDQIAYVVLMGIARTISASSQNAVP